MYEKRNLSELSVGESATVGGVTHAGSARRRLMELGLSAGREVTCVGVSPLGDPHAYILSGAVIAIRNSDARGILLES